MEICETLVVSSASIWTDQILFLSVVLSLWDTALHLSWSARLESIHRQLQETVAAFALKRPRHSLESVESSRSELPCPKTRREVPILPWHWISIVVLWGQYQSRADCGVHIALPAIRRNGSSSRVSIRLEANPNVSFPWAVEFLSSFWRTECIQRNKEISKRKFAL